MEKLTNELLIACLTGIFLMKLKSKTRVNLYKARKTFTQINIS